MRVLFIVFALIIGTISCGKSGKDGAVGVNGAQGIAGPSGSNGHSIVVNSASANSQQCSNGGSIIVFAIDINDNLSFDLTDVPSNSIVICNGEDGSPGKPSDYTPVSIIDPCGNSPSVIDEVLIKLNDGSVLASVSEDPSGTNTRLSLLTLPGSYTTTDGTNCHFSLNSAGNIYNEHF